MKKVNFLYISFVFILIYTSAFSQSNSQVLAGDKIFSVNYSLGIPNGSLHNFISNKMINGFNADVRSFITDKFAAGLSIGWNNFKEQYPRETYPNGNGSYSSVRTKYLSTAPVMLTGFYHFTTNKKINPYATAGAGIHLVTYNKWDGAFGDSKSSVKFGARLGAGVLVPFTDTFGLNLTARYNYAAFSYNEVKDIQYLDVSLGLYFISF